VAVVDGVRRIIDSMNKRIDSYTFYSTSTLNGGNIEDMKKYKTLEGMNYNKKDRLK
jgi:hypothetical protein